MSKTMHESNNGSHKASAKLREMLDSVWINAELEVKAMRRHYEAGRRDCQLGVYDKWYRYNTVQDGRAYDIGWMEQNETTQNETVKFLDAYKPKED